MADRRQGQVITEHVAPARRGDVLLNVLGPLVVVALLALLPYPRYLRYREMGGDAGKIRWVYERIHAADRPIDLALVGSSRTMTAVDDSLLEADLAAGGRGPRVANLAVAWEGRDLNYVLAKELLTGPGCRTLVVEVPAHEPRRGHPYFRDLADPHDVLAAPLVLNPRYLQDLLHVLPRELRLLGVSWRARAAGAARELAPPSRVAPFHPVLRRETLAPAELQRLGERRLATVTPRVLPAALDRLEYGLPRSYLRRMAGLAADAGASLVLLYLPGYAGPEQPADLAFYRELGPVLVPPRALVDDPDNWADAGHLNARGNAAFTRWLAGALAAPAAEGPR